MRHRTVPVTAALIGMLVMLTGGTAACGARTDPPSPPPRTYAEGVPVASPSTTVVPHPTTELDLWAPPPEKIERDLVSQVLFQTRRPAPYSSACNPEITSAPKQNVACTVVYDGLEIPFEVAITFSGSVYQYKTVQKKFVLTRDAVHFKWWDSNRQHSAVKCDPGIPEKELLDIPAVTTPYTCTADVPGRGPGRWMVAVGDQGSISFDFVK